MNCVIFRVREMQTALLLVLATAVATKEISAAGRECEADHECDNGYCYRDTGVCTSCTDCQIYLRKPPEWKSCARGHQDCGDCVDGFEVEVLADGSTRDYCVPLKNQESEQKHVDRSTNFWLLIGGVPVILIIIAAIVIFTFYRGVKQSGSSSSAPEDPPPPPLPGIDHDDPPSYESSEPLLDSLPLGNSISIVEKEGNNLQQAVPFTNPHPPYGPDGSAGGGVPVFEDNSHHVEMYDPSAPSPSDSNDEEEGPRAISPPQLEDEDTVPSDWTPGNCYAVRRPSPVTEGEQQPAPTSSTCSSSTSSLTNPEELRDGNHGGVLNDSGVSTSNSHQSGLSCVARSLETLVQGGAVGSVHAILEHHHSEDDVSTLAELRANKRQRCDSGSASAQSLQPL